MLSFKTFVRGYSSRKLHTSRESRQILNLTVCMWRVNEKFSDNCDSFQYFVSSFISPHRPIIRPWDEAEKNSLWTRGSFQYYLKLKKREMTSSAQRNGKRSVHNCILTMSNIWTRDPERVKCFFSCVLTSIIE